MELQVMENAITKIKKNRGRNSGKLDADETKINEVVNRVTEDSGSGSSGRALA
jgi:hypothetical protein